MIRTSQKADPLIRKSAGVQFHAGCADKLSNFPDWHRISAVRVIKLKQISSMGPIEISKKEEAFIDGQVV
ncbi:hypothetical protein [Bradyrhizobium yuanmingense]|uniref:hypothetical protein n=1 Tax=Bradyrhizobium yuanmingense TaxID=108015 RepID=UPI0012FDB7DF|nr:hypothetical protein [Bradyrhizobium yuanmingense]